MSRKKSLVSTHMMTKIKALLITAVVHNTYNNNNNNDNKTDDNISTFFKVLKDSVLNFKT